jgi:hypothetical protein
VGSGVSEVLAAFVTNIANGYWESLRPGVGLDRRCLRSRRRMCAGLRNGRAEHAEGKLTMCSDEAIRFGGGKSERFTQDQAIFFE